MKNYLTERQLSWLSMGFLWALLLLLSVLRPLAVPDEGRYGDVGRAMLLQGDWLTPRLNGIPFFHKPPLLHWLQSLSLTVFGINEFALRLVPALHVGLMTVVLYLSVRTAASEAMARRAAIMLGSGLAFMVGGQYVNHDMLVATWIGVAIWCFAFAFQAGERPHATLARLGFVACGLGMMSKGLIGIALPGLVLLVWLLWTRQLRKMLYLPWISGLALFAAVVVPWFALAQHKYPELLNYMFVHHHFARYTAKTFNNPQPVWFFVLAIGLLMFPWAFWAAAAWRKRTGTAVAALVPGPWLSLCWIWVICITVFFSMPSSKLVGYILPVMPPVAWLAAMGWERVMANRAWGAKLFGALVALNIGIATTMVLLVGGVTAPGRSEDMARILACEARPGDTVYALRGFPYDLPFYTQAAKPMIVLHDWAERRANARDGWERELFEGADFDAESAKVLQGVEVLAQASQVPGNWLIARKGESGRAVDAGWKPFAQGVGWDLLQSAGTSATEGPETAQQKGLPGCQHQGNT